MLPKVVVVSANYALCENCGRIDWCAYQPFWNALRSRAGPLEISDSRGIAFWTPPSDLPDIDAYLRWLILCELASPDSGGKLSGW